MMKIRKKTGAVIVLLLTLNMVVNTGMMSAVEAVQVLTWII